MPADAGRPGGRPSAWSSGERQICRKGAHHPQLAANLLHILLASPCNTARSHRSHFLLVAPAVFTPAPLASQSYVADAETSAVLSLAPDAVKLLADAPLAVMLTDAGVPAVLAPVLDVVMLADAGVPAVLAPLAVVLALLAHASPCSTVSSACCPRRVAVSPLLVALAALALVLPVPAPAPLPHTGQARARSNSAGKSVSRR